MNNQAIAFNEDSTVKAIFLQLHMESISLIDFF